MKRNEDQLMSYSLERVYQVWNDDSGERLEVKGERDLTVIRYVGQ